MPRPPRKKSNTGVYHVMLRGNNKQNIFFSRDDFQQMQWTLVEAQRHRDANGKIIDCDECTIYAYCIMNNHVHILLREGTKDLSQIMHKIEDRYVHIYNKKYDRVGHLFQGRFRSEPVNDISYFHILLRYIHRNPVVGMECDRPEEYDYSSWQEFLPNHNCDITVLLPKAFHTIDHYFNRDELIEWVNQDVHDECMDMTSERFVVTDQHAWDILSDVSGETNPEDFRSLSQDLQLHYLRQAVSSGITLRQASRLSSLSYYFIQKYISEQEPIKVPGTLIEKSTELSCQLDDVSAIMKKKITAIVQYANEHPSFSCNDICNLLGMSDSMGRRVLRIMVDKQILSVEGNTKARIYSFNSVNQGAWHLD